MIRSLDSVWRFPRRLFVLTGLLFFVAGQVKADDVQPVLRIGIIGLDTSHVPAFTKEFNREQPAGSPLAGFRVVAAYPWGSKQIESSKSRIPKYTEAVEELGVEVVDSIDALLAKVDCVLLETNDGNPHLEQAIKVFRAGKPVFIDKPAGADLANVLAIFSAAEKYKVPMFSSSSLRYSRGPQSVRGGKVGRVLGCGSYSPCAIEPSHVDLYWYGIHGVEILFTCMGTGCESVAHSSSKDFELAVGRWSDGRIGTFRGIRSGKSGYGGTAFGETAIVDLGSYDGYQPLVLEIAKFFRTEVAPIDPKETIEIYAFMQAAHASKLDGGRPVKIQQVMESAQAESILLLEKLGEKPDSFTSPSSADE